MSDQTQRTDHDQEWLIKSQQLLTNVRGWLSRGLSETAMNEIDDYWRKWREGHDAGR